MHGFSVLEAENAADGLKAATFNAPDLIILDLALPDVHGKDVLERIRSWSNVPVIMRCGDTSRARPKIRSSQPALYRLTSSLEQWRSTRTRSD
ncbi:response regulator [Bradyrhizobium sp. AZCC 2289]|uniref:response regulator n=1 Tax=Bradyrhizobium sp. AZCC 2289 TaxID=3117026 RepID=UPI003FA59B82